MINAFNQFFEHVKEQKIFSISEFIKEMEPKFEAAGYRQTPKVTAYSERRQTKILLIQDAGAGDFVIHTGLIREIRRIYPKAYIALIVKPQAFQLAELCPYVDEVIINRGKFIYVNFSEIFIDYVKFAEKLLSYKFDICFSLAYMSETPLLMYMSGARVRIAANIYAGENDEKSFSNTTLFNFKSAAQFLTDIVPIISYRCHRVDTAFSMLEYFLHAPIENRSLEIWYSPFDLSIAKDFVAGASPLYALCMGGSHPRKFYPPEKYAKFLELVINDEPSAKFVILGGGNNDLQSAEILKNSVPKIYAENVIDLTHKISYRQSAAVLSLCNAYIGNDTGTMHLAAAVNCPVMEINCFPADVPILEGDDLAVYYPYGVPNVIVRPKNALPECTADKPHNSYGCRILIQPHCITQINPQILYDGFKFLKKRIAENNLKPLYIS